MKKALATTAVLFLYIFVFEWVFHGIMLAEQYRATAYLWRPESEMMARMGWMVGGQFLIAVFLSRIFGHLESGYVKMGALLGALYGAGQLIMYSVAPYTLLLTVVWVVGAVVEYALAGLVYGFVVALLLRRTVSQDYIP